MTNETLSYYNTNAASFIDNTKDVIFTETQDKFLSAVNSAFNEQNKK